MTDATIEEKCAKLGSKMEEMFGEKMADPAIFPRIFNYQARLALFEMSLSKDGDDDGELPSGPDLSTKEESGDSSTNS